MNGITYFRLESDYDGDYTKKCGLTGQEIDNNFYVLEGRDVKSLEVDGDDITIVLYNGNRITAEDALSGYAKDLSFDFDKKNGTLTITQNGETTTIEGFCCENCGKVYTDITLVGDGTKENPLGVAGNAQTGHYKPVLDILDFTINPSEMPENPNRGDRYVVKNLISNYGKFYNYCGVKHICCELRRISSEWRIPTLEDWNGMLNAIEPDDESRTHNATNAHGYHYSGRFLGKYAGKFLKGNCGWETCENSDDEDCNCGNSAENGCEGNQNPCMPMDCHHQQLDDSGVTSESTEPYDCFNLKFNAIPLGKIESGTSVAMGKRAYFWTGFNSENEAYAKAFDYCSNAVWQELVSKTIHMPLRLVKDFTGNNSFGQETIFGQVYETTLAPFIDENGERTNKVWTTVNVSFDTPCGDINPPDGLECADITNAYSIAEWNGSYWTYTKLYEGEIVTSLSDYNDYKLVNGELVLNNNNYDSDIEELANRITTNETNIADLTERVVKLEDAVGEYDTDKGTIANRLDETDAIIGDYANEKTISERLDAIEEKLTVIESKLDNWLDFNDRDNDEINEPEIPYDKDEDGGGDGIKVGENEEGENIYW